MPLRDHFRSPLDDIHSCDELHGMWPAVIVQHLVRSLPEPYFAALSVNLGSLFGVDVANYRERLPNPQPEAPEDGGVALATYAPPMPTLTLEPELPDQDLHEVRIYDSRRNRRLVAAIEIVSPSNKDRPEHRESFVSKVATLVRNRVCVSVVDVVSTMQHNFYADLVRRIRASTPRGAAHPRRCTPSPFARGMKDAEGCSTPGPPPRDRSAVATLPVWLRGTFAVSPDLEPSYEETCRTLRIR